tara:strand:+ start:736 stop:1047 length:312 start_codon:yes stop_codon:yes gene_type:complete
VNTIAAIVFMIGCGVLIFLAALTWGFLKACVAILFFLIGVFQSISAGEIYSAILAANFVNIFTSFFEPFGTFFSASWSWAKYEHPWIAFFLGLVSISGSSQLK